MSSISILLCLWFYKTGTWQIDENFICYVYFETSFSNYLYFFSLVEGAKISAYIKWSLHHSGKLASSSKQKIYLHLPKRTSLYNKKLSW
jgi:hypothetical protein